MISKRVCAKDLKIGDMLRSNGVIASVQVDTGLGRTNKKVHLVIKYPNRDKPFFTSWGKYTMITVFNCTE